MADNENNIPREFHSAYKEGPFTECIDCGCQLNESHAPYVIMKSVVANEAVFEMAICMMCAGKMRERYSEETKKNLQSYMADRLIEQQIRLAEREATEEPDDLAAQYAERISECAFCEKPQIECRRYEIVGQFFPDQLFALLPEEARRANVQTVMMLCEDCNSAMSELVSKQTRDSWDRFVEEHFDGPPGIELDSPSYDPILF